MDDSSADGSAGIAVARNTLIAVTVLAAALFLWMVRQAVLLAFAGLILAVLLSGMARAMRRILPLSRRWSLVIVGLILIGLLGLFGVFMGPQISTEFQILFERLPQQIEEVREQLRGTRFGDTLLGASDEDGASATWLSLEQARGLLFQAGYTMLDILMSFILVLFVGIFFAADPGLYRRGITLLAPKRREERVEEALAASANALWQWLLGQLVAMAFIGVSVAVGLSLIGVPLALTLGLIAGLLNFVPFVGPIVSAVPGVLFAFSNGPQDALLAALVYFTAQQIESYAVVPYVQQRRVSLPPAVLLLSLIVFGLVFGILGVILAGPLAVLVLVLVRMLYVQDVLGKEVSIPGRR